MSEGLRRPEGIAPWANFRPAPGKGAHPLLAAFAVLGWRPTNNVVRWIRTLPRNLPVGEAIAKIPPRWTDTLESLGAALRAVRPVPWDLLQRLPAWAAHGTEPQPDRHPAEAWRKP